jgi:eukaryotic-like serine/threonine-protein kinase
MTRVAAVQDTWEPGGEPSEAERIALEALDIGDAARGPFVEDACGGDEVLVAAVHALLDEFTESDRWLQRVALRSGALLETSGGDGSEAGGPGDSGEAEPPVPMPAFIGPYRVLGCLGRGGMGVVYLAERPDRDFRMRVAVKVLHPHLATGPHRRRFLSEQRILARLSHPGIARLIDGAVLDDGTPYLVMEFVEGHDLVTWARDRDLGVRERVALFQQVCRAVAYAHRSLVVHRDLKPSNTRVTEEGEVKLLDFGIARVLDLVDEEEGEITRLHPFFGVPLTPGYASPEQLRGEAIGTPSDVYSMGILLRRLLLPPPDGDRWSRRADPPPLPSGLDQDLAAILEKAARPEPEARYGSAVELGEDLARFLEGLPVLARAGSTRYRLKKMVVRHRWAVAVIGIALLGVVAGGVGLAVHASRVQAERDVARLETERAEAVTAFLVDLFDVAGDGTPMDTVRAGTLLRLGEDRLRERLDPHPLVRSSLLAALARANARLGVLQAEERLMEERVEVMKSFHGPDHVEVARALVRAARVRIRGRHWVQADALLQEALGILDARSRTRAPETAAEVRLRVEALGQLAQALRYRELPDSAIAVGRAAMALNQEVAARDRDLIFTMSSLASALRGNGDLEGAEALMREALAVVEQAEAPHGPNHVSLLNNLASTLRARGAMEEAELRFRQALDLEVGLSGKASSESETVAGNLASLLSALDRRSEAEALLVSMEEAIVATHPPDHWRVGRIRARRGGIWEETPECFRGLPLLEDARRIYENALGADHGWTAGVEVQMAECAIILGRPDEAAPLLEGALPRLLGATNPNRTIIRIATDLLAGIHEAEGRTAEAEAVRRMAGGG